MITNFKIFEQKQNLKILFSILKNSERPYIDILKLYENDELEIICPVLFELSHTEEGHKNNFLHTLQVLKNVCDNNYSYEMKIVALFHDIGKPKTKRKIGNNDWSFHNHEAVGANMFVKLCKENSITDIDIDYLYRMILNHGRVKMHRDVTESAIRRLSTDVGSDIIFDIINFSKCDLTTKNKIKYEKIASDLDTIRDRIIEVSKKDEYNAWRSPLTGFVIMDLFNNKIDGRKIGEIKRKYDLILRNNEMTIDEVIDDIKKNYL